MNTSTTCIDLSTEASFLTTESTAEYYTVETTTNSSSDSVNASVETSTDLLVCTEHEPPDMKPYGYIVLVLSLVACVGNLLVIVAVLKSKRLWKPPNYFVVNLSISDGVFGAFILPFNSYSMIGGSWGLRQTMCTITGYGSYLILGISTMSLGCMAINRYFAIVWPTRYVTIGAGKVSGGMVFITYFFSVLVMLPAFSGISGEVGFDPVAKRCTLVESKSELLR
jgi:hypothetical protein